MKTPTTCPLSTTTAEPYFLSGARVERVNWRGDVSEKGLRESAGLMVNYLYDPAKIEDYHEEYVGEGKRPAATAIRKLARGWG